MIIQHKVKRTAEARAARKQYVNERCRVVIESGFTSSALGAPHFYEFRDYDQSNIQAAFSLVKETGQPRPLKCFDSEGVEGYRPHTEAQFVQLGLDAEAHKMTALSKVLQLRQMIDGASTVEEVQEVSWDSL